MGAYYQSAWRNLTMLALCILAAGFFSWRFFDDNGSYINLVYLACAMVGGLHGGWGFIQKEPAIAFDRNGLRLKRWCGTAEIPWNEVHDVSTKVVTIRGTEVKWLSVACDGGFFGSRTVSVSLASLDVASGSEEMVAASIYQAWVSAVGESATLMAAAGHKGWGAQFYDTPEPANQFDADAAFARYQSRQNIASASEPLSPQTSPGTTLAGSPPPPLVNRPVFGRKGA